MSKQRNSQRLQTGDHNCGQDQGKQGSYGTAAPGGDAATLENWLVILQNTQLLCGRAISLLGFYLFVLALVLSFLRQKQKTKKTKKQKNI
jgi:preprotein translocase subunit SecG